MLNGRPTLYSLAALLVCCGVTNAAAPGAATRLAVADVRFEQNATDGDVEVVFEVTGRRDGLASLTIVAPDGRTVVDFRTESALGIRQFVFESPEPTDVESLQQAYPEGVYAFTGTSVSGARLVGEATLKHELPATTAFISPPAGANDVPSEGLTLQWKPVEGLLGYIVEIEQDELQVSITTRLPPTQPTFHLPAGFLQPGREYKLGIGTLSQDGNTSFVETDFTTADE